MTPVQKSKGSLGLKVSFNLKKKKPKKKNNPNGPQKQPSLNKILHGAQNPERILEGSERHLQPDPNKERQNQPSLNKNMKPKKSRRDPWGMVDWDDRSAIFNQIQTRRWPSDQRGGHFWYPTWRQFEPSTQKESQRWRSGGGRGGGVGWN